MPARSAGPDASPRARRTRSSARAATAPSPSSSPFPASNLLLVPDDLPFEAAALDRAIHRRAAHAGPGPLPARRYRRRPRRRIDRPHARPVAADRRRAADRGHGPHRREPRSRPGARARIVTLDPAQDDVPAEVVRLTDGGADLVLEATGSPAALGQTIDVARPRGAIVLGGNQPLDASLPMAFVEGLMRKELTLAGCFMSYSAPWPGHEWTDGLASVLDGGLDMAADDLPPRPAVRGAGAVRRDRRAPAHPPQDRVRPQLVEEVRCSSPVCSTPGSSRALGEAGHGAQVLIADGNYPLRTRSNEAAQRVYLNLAPGLVSVTDVLRALVDAIPIEAAHVMTPGRRERARRSSRTSGGCSPASTSSASDGSRSTTPQRGPDVALAIATGEQRLYANLLLTIGVVTPDASPAPTAASDPTTRSREDRYMPTINTTGRFVGDWPKIGIRPAVDGRQHGVRESLDAQTRAMAERTRRAHPLDAPLPGRHAGRGRRPRPQHRRRRTRRPRSPSCSGSRASASRSRSRPAGATGPRRWTWTR